MPANPNPKNIVVCCDGTGNQYGNAKDPDQIQLSNVVKLYTALTIDNQQVGYYHPGVGTMGAPEARTWLGKHWSRLKGLAFADGFMPNVEDAYRYLMETYNDGDQIYLFGFSRGSYTARALAAILQAFGLLCKGNEGQIPYIFRLFEDDMKAARKTSRRLRGSAAQKMTYLNVDTAFKQTFCHDVTLRFVGLWDTVSSVGWITQPMKLLYSAQNPIIQTGRHAVSIDERRCFYQDNLWGKALHPSETPTLGTKLVNPDGTYKLNADGTVALDPIQQDILQVWFPGVHSDVGGSYMQSESALSNHTLEWMIDQARAHGVLLEEDRVNLVFGRPTKKKYAATPFFITPKEPNILHKSLHGIGWWLLELIPHHYYVMDTDQQHLRIPLGASRTLPEDAIVHSSVVERMKDTKNDPELRYTPRNIVEKGKLVPMPHPCRQPGTAEDLTGYFLFKSNDPAPARRNRADLRPPHKAQPVTILQTPTAIKVLGAAALLLTAAAAAVLHTRST
jgi:uncharacterized protein (DUF2235 family)